MLNTRVRAALLAALLFALPFAAPTQEVEKNPSVDRLVEKYKEFAGSSANAEKFVHALRNDLTVEFPRDGAQPLEFTPDTAKMGYGNVDIALSLAKATLADHGINQPTPEDIVAALNGGTTKTGNIELTGILELRAKGMGWGQIAQANGFKLGELMRNEKANREAKTLDNKHAQVQRTRLERPDRPHRFDRPERPERPDRPERSDRR
jgi:hypothetical protein